jgi:hypothetical protein
MMEDVLPSPFGPPRTTPRRPDVDLRPMMRQALVLLGLVPLAVGLYGALNHPDEAGVWWGLAFSGGVVTVAYLLSLRHEGAHQSKSPEFWLAWEARDRPRGFLIAVGGAVVAVCAAVFGLIVGQHQLTAFAAPPLALAVVVLVLLWGKIP